MGNRPINRRPWRKPPWRARRRRPGVWRDATSVSTLETEKGYPWAALGGPTGTDAQHTLREILAGDIDAFTLDKNEVLVDRIVGDIQFWTVSFYDGASALALPPVVRWGLVVEEDPAEVGVINALSYDLWHRIPLQETEWMHLSQPDWKPAGGAVASDPDASTLYCREFVTHEHVDIRVKRKLGKTDRLWLVMSYGNGREGVAGSNDWGSTVYHSHMLRAILVP